MNLQSYHRFFQAGFTACTLILVSGSLAFVHLFNSNKIAQLPTSALTTIWPENTPDEFAFDATVFKKITFDSANVSQDSMAKRFRLAGTFFAFGINQHSRKAILDDLQKREQLLVSEGDLIDHAQGLIDNKVWVKAIMSDRIILRTGSMNEEIMLSFAGNLQPGSQTAAYQNTSGGKLPPEIQNRFGKRVGNKRWVLTRTELLNYYKEVLNDTDRLARIYDSLKPVYEERNIAGYSLVIEGESDMFTAFGLQEGDIIRQVNSMPMTSQVRAEYFINEFVKNRVNGFVLDIERSGRKEKLIYMIR